MMGFIDSTYKVLVVVSHVNLGLQIDLYPKKWTPS